MGFYVWGTAGLRFGITWAILPEVESHSSSNAPTLRNEDRAALLVRRAKVGLFQARRLFSWYTRPGAWPAPRLLSNDSAFPYCIYQHRVPLSREDDAAHPIFEQGKRTNVALAVPSFHGLLLSPTRPFSFWRTLGRVTAHQGFAYGMEIRGGCLVPALGGGLCLVSNALFRMAVHTGCHIIERHAHTTEAVPPVSNEVWGLDATVFWPYVDLRFEPLRDPLWLSMTIDADVLHIQVFSSQPAVGEVQLSSEQDVVEETPQGRFRSNHVLRRWVDPVTHEVLQTDVVATTRKRLLHQDEQRRNCFTCEETECTTRKRVLPLVAAFSESGAVRKLNVISGQQGGNHACGSCS